MTPDESRNRAVDPPSGHGDGRNGPDPHPGTGDGSRSAAAAPVARNAQVVRAGQIWRDGYPGPERHIQVLAVDATHATVVTVHPDGTRGRRTRIRLDRFRPGTRGYHLKGES